MKKIASKKTTSRFYLAIIALVVGITPFLASCEKEMEGGEYRVYDDKMIDEIMQDQGFTSFLSIVDKANFRGTIHAYGAYTFFVPTNEAINIYLQAKGKSDVNDLTEEESANIVKYHLIANDSIGVSDFVDGRLRNRNFMKKFLDTKRQANASIKVNRQATIITKSVAKGMKDDQLELKGANGFLHVIDAVLLPPEKSIAQTIRALPDAEFSLMKQFFEKSGLADSLEMESDSIWFTFFVQDNEAFKEAGITSEEELIAELRDKQKSTTKTDDELIRDYVGYHAVKNIIPKYAVDLLYPSALETLTPEKKPLRFERVEDKIWIDRLITDKISDLGVELSRASEYTDLACSNGVMHQVLGNIQIKERSAYRVYWDLATQPEIMALSTYRKYMAQELTFNSGELSEITWGGTYLATIKYGSKGLPASEGALDSKFQDVYGDYIVFNLNSATIPWIEFKLPVLMPGEYKVWVCYRRQLNLTIRTIFKQEGKDDQVMPYIFNMNEYMFIGTPEQMEILGWKQYTAKKRESVMCSHILGTIKVEFEGRHTLRLEPISSGAKGQSGRWDMIQFIPKEENQIFPRIDMLGNWIEEDVPSWEIFPYGTPPATE